MDAPEAFEEWWRHYPLPNDRVTADQVRHAWDAGVLFERAACLAICIEADRQDETDNGAAGTGAAAYAADAILARK